jgi:hypothetical protein
MKSLYCYFGALGTKNTLDIPGHTFYQLPLLEATAAHLDIDSKFDFFSYVPESVYVAASGQIEFHDDAIGQALAAMHEDLIVNRDALKYDAVICNIRNKEYSYLLLKARFRNLSTLSKKWNDAAKFEEIIHTALETGYNPDKIIILDTDLSLPDRFVDWAIRAGIRILTPSIDYSPMRIDRALNFIELIEKSNEDKDRMFNYTNHVVYYGNLNTSSYKAGHGKNNIVFGCLQETPKLEHYGLSYGLTIIGKEIPSSLKNIDFYHVNRANRTDVWNELRSSKVCLNVSKDLYVKKGFVPARVYEAIMLGQIPVSYNMPKIHPALSFSSVDEYLEILKFIVELNDEDYKALRRTVVRYFME